MTSNEDLLTAIGSVSGDVKALSAVTQAHVKQTRVDREVHERRLNDHADRLRGQEQEVGNHLTRHSQTRWIVGVVLGVFGTIAAFWNKSGLGG